MMRGSVSSLGACSPSAVPAVCALRGGQSWADAPICVVLAKDCDILIHTDERALVRGHLGDTTVDHGLVYQIVYLCAVTYLLYLDADIFSATDEVTSAHPHRSSVHGGALLELTRKRDESASVAHLRGVHRGAGATMASSSWYF